MEWERLLVPAVTGALFGILANVWLHRRAQWIEMQTLCRSLAREAELIVRKLEEYHAAARGSHIPLWPRLAMDQDDMLVFRTNGGKLGLMEPTLVFRTMKFYGMVRAAISAAQNLATRPQVVQRGAADESALDVAAGNAENAAIYGRLGANAKGLEYGLIASLESFARVGWWRYQWLVGIAGSRRLFVKPRKVGESA